MATSSTPTPSVETADGDFIIKDKTLREEVLKLREDPQVAADLAAAFTRNNGAYLLEKFGRMPSPGELYIAHFLGAKGAEKMFTPGLADPNQIAAELFPKQAKANPTIFYADGQPRTIRQVYRALVAKHDGARSPPTRPSSPSRSAAEPAAKWPDAQAIPSRFAPDDMSFTALFSTEGEIKPRALLSARRGAAGELPSSPSSTASDRR